MESSGLLESKNVRYGVHPFLIIEGRYEQDEHDAQKNEGQNQQMEDHLLLRNKVHEVCRNQAAFQRRNSKGDRQSWPYRQLHISNGYRHNRQHGKRAEHDQVGPNVLLDFFGAMGF